MINDVVESIVLIHDGKMLLEEDDEEEANNADDEDVLNLFTS